jgi:hypothetical protein
MAYGLLKALGVPPRNQAIRRDLVKSGTSFEVTVDPLPYAVEEKARRILPFLPFSAEFNRVSLVINGLTAPAAVLEFDGRLTPVFDRAALEAGLPLSEMWGIGAMEEAERAAMITREKTNMYRQFWRALALPDNWWMEAPYDPEPHRIALEAAGELETWRRKTVIPRPMRVTVRAVDDRPVQLNAGGAITRWRASAGFAPVPSRTFTGAELARLTNPGVALPGWPRVALDGVPADRLACAYARSLPSPFSVLAVVESDGPQKATVILEGEGPVTAYLNGRQVKEIKGDKESREIELDLKQGENRLALAFPYRKGGIRGFVARITAVSQGIRNRW